MNDTNVAVEDTVGNDSNDANAGAGVPTGGNLGAATAGPRILPNGAAIAIDPEANRLAALTRCVVGKAKEAVAASTVADNTTTNNNSGQVMGPRSQNRISLNKRTNQLKSRASNYNNACRPTGQTTLQGGQGFEPSLHCKICKAREIKKTNPDHNIPHRGHHELCWNNSQAQNIAGATQSLQQKRTDKALRRTNSEPIFWSQTNFKRNFWRPRKRRKKNHNMNTTNNNNNNTNTAGAAGDTPTDSYFEPEDFLAGMNNAFKDKKRMDDFKTTRCPIAMLAFAEFVAKNVVETKESYKYFDGLTLTVPEADGMHSDPQCHSIVGQKLLLADWEATHGITNICCPMCEKGELKNFRTNYSHNKTLFPMFGIHGPPSWCMVQKMECKSCKKKIWANHGAILSRLPDYAALSCPVDPKYAIPKTKCHLARSATDVFNHLMVTYLGGDSCSNLLYDAINRAHMEKIRSYYSYNKGNDNVPKYIDKNTECIKKYPPQGDTVRDHYKDASNSEWNHWLVSDKNRHKREIMGVDCDDGLYVEDHTFETAKNYYNRKEIGANAVWNSMTGVKQVSCSVCVPTAHRRDIAHAAIQQAKRPWFNPRAKYSDRYPHNHEFFVRAHGKELDGRLGLFHWMQRITKTLDDRNPKYKVALKELKLAVHNEVKEDVDGVIAALKAGTLGGRKHTDEDIEDLRNTKHFKSRYSKYIRKKINRADAINVRLDEWNETYNKKNLNDMRCGACGQNTASTHPPLFTLKTEKAIKNCKLNTQCLQDPLELEDMYIEIKPSPNSKHGLSEWISIRGESNLESFHLLLAHFANCGMNKSLADNLNLTGTARHNLKIRHKMRLAAKDISERDNMPAGWETVVDYFNHSELQYVNTLARSSGISEDNLPFPEAETLVEDTGELFFSEYLDWLKQYREEYKTNDIYDLCKCNKCVAPPNVTVTTPRNSNNTTTNDSTNDSTNITNNSTTNNNHNTTTTNNHNTTTTATTNTTNPPQRNNNIGRMAARAARSAREQQTAQPTARPTATAITTQQHNIPIAPAPPPPARPTATAITTQQHNIPIAPAPPPPPVVPQQMQNQMMWLDPNMFFNPNLFVPPPRTWGGGYCCNEWREYQKEKKRGRPPNRAHSRLCPNHNSNK